MKRLSLQWRITLLTALLIACACVCMNLLLYRTGVTGMDALNGFMMQYQPGSADSLTIEIPQEEMSSLLAHFSQEVYDAKVVFGRKGWCITAVVTILSAAIAYFVSGRALKPLQQLAQQAQRVDQDSIATVRLDEDTVQEFGQLSRSVNRMLDGLAQSFELQRQFAGNAAHELRTPLAILQTKLELFAEEHPAMDAETAGLVSSLREQLDRLTALVRTLLEMSNLQSVSRTDQIALAPLVEEILTDLTSLAQKNNISLQQDCAELGMVGSDALIYRLVFNLVENGIKYNRPGGAVRVTLRQEKQAAVLRVADTGPGIPADCRESIFQPFFRVDKSRSREMGGVGLGLALVREIAVLHGTSGHADQKGLLNWVEAFERKPEVVFINHGDTEACEAFQALLQQKGYVAIAPFSGAQFDLAAGKLTAFPAGRPIAKKGAARKKSVFDALIAAAQRLLLVAQGCKERPNRDLTRFTAQIQALIDRWEK